jgi:carbamoylphosphate synthase large subunit
MRFSTCPTKSLNGTCSTCWQGVNHLCRTEKVQRIVPLDDFDLEKAALLREHLRVPGFGETATRYFRDKLAMRMRAAESGINVPPFTSTSHYQDITDFLEKVPPPWVIKPRMMAGAMGIRKCDNKEDVWDRIHRLGDEQSYFVLEQFVPGDIFHVDSIWFKGEVVFAISSAYGTPPLEVANDGGIFTTETLEAGSSVDVSLREMNKTVLSAFGLRDGVSHTEFIKAKSDGAVYFLETSARVGGANIADLIETASGLNMWAEWAKVETATATGGDYKPIEEPRQQAGLLVSLARQEWPDTGGFNEPELVWQLKKKHHVGFIVKSPQRERVAELLKLYTERVRRDFHASAPPRDKPGE